MHVLPGMELMSCQNLAVPMDVMQHVVRVESSYNPYAIGVVGGRLQRQPRNLSEALATVRMLESRGFNFSLGLAQVNRYNLARYGLASYEQAFQPCANLQAGSRILAECYRRSGRDWGKSFSCYYSGNFVTGFRHGYVQKVFAAMGRATATAAASVDAIPVLSRANRRSVPVSRYPVQAGASIVEQRTAMQPSPVSPPAPVAVAAAVPSVAQPPATAHPAPAAPPALAPADAVAVLEPDGRPPRLVLPAAGAGPTPTNEISRDSAFVF